MNRTGRVLSSLWRIIPAVIAGTGVLVAAQTRPEPGATAAFYFGGSLFTAGGEVRSEPKQGRAGVTISTDLGKTWSNMTHTATEGQQELFVCHRLSLIAPRFARAPDKNCHVAGGHVWQIQRSVAAAAA